MVSKIVVFSATILYFSMFAHGAYTDCGSVDGSIVNVVIKGCENMPVCDLKIGANVTVNLEFVSDVVSSVVEEVVTVVDSIPKLLGSVLGSVLGTLVGINEPCTGSGIICPLQIGETYNYMTILPITSLVPKVGVNLVVKLRNGNGECIVCAKIPVNIIA